jgi:iron complex outermembrane receptor protein
MQKHSRFARILGMTAALFAFAGATAHGQSTPAPAAEEDEEIVITGSSIRGVAGTGSPVAGYDLEELKATGLATSADLARALPQIASLGADEGRLAGAQDAAANTTRTGAINIRGIGNEATLVLVNGRRIAPGGVIRALTDPNVIPTSAIQRLEVVLDGASAIYGSDAVGGVVNIITRRNFEGAETTGRYGFGDGIDQIIASQTYGTGWDGGSLFAAYEHNFRSSLSGADRAEFSSQDRTSRGGTDVRSFLSQPGNICSAAATCGAGATRYPLPNTNGVGLTPAGLPAGPGNRFDEGTFADLLPEQNRDTIFADIRQELGAFEFWYQGFYTRRQFEELVAPASGSLTVPNTNPWYVQPTGITMPGSGTPRVTVEYRFLAEDPDPKLEGWENARQHALGFNLDTIGDWEVDTYASFSLSRGFQRREAITNGAALTAALNSSNPATAFNPFGNGSFNLTNNPALVDIIMANRDTYGTSMSNDYAIKADGSLFALPGGDLRMAFGYERHDTKFSQLLNATNVAADGSNTSKSVLNERHVNSLFTELFVPIVGADNALPGIDRLELSLAGRLDEYSDFGDTKNPKVGIVYGPIPDLSLRATYGTSFRAPSLVDTSEQIHNIFIQNLAAPGGTTVRGIFHNGGRATLQPEEAETYSYGFDWKPSSFLDGLDVSFSYYTIDYTNRIDVVPNTAFSTTLNQTVYAPYIIRRPSTVTLGADDTAFNALVASFMANPDLQSPVEAVTNINLIIDGRRANLGTVQQKGFDLGVGYSFSTPVGDWRLGADVAKILELNRATAPGVAFVDVVDTFGNPNDLRVRGSVGWKLGGWSANGFVNHTTGYLNGATEIAEYTTVDASVSYNFDDSGPLGGVRLTLAGQNVLDEDPPVVLNGTSSWDREQASAIGRFFSFEVSKSW